MQQFYEFTIAITIISILIVDLLTVAMKPSPKHPQIVEI